MITKTINNKEYQIIDNYKDISLYQYLTFVEAGLFDVTEDSNLTDDELEKSMKLIEIFTGMSEGESENLMISELRELSYLVKDAAIALGGPENLTMLLERSFTLNDTLYVTRDIKSLDDLTSGEMFSIKTLQQSHKNNKDLFSRICAVLIRPGKETIDQETKEKTYEIEDFNRKDLMNLDFRADLFLKSAKAYNTIPVLNFFLTMNNE